MIKLYDYYRSTASYRVRIALNLKKLDYELIPVNLIKDGGEQHSDAYQTLNPQKLVPLFEDSDLQFTLSQSIAIIEYLDETYPEIACLPTNRIQKAKARQIAQMIACDIHPLNNLRVLQYLVKTLNVSEEDKLKWYHHWLKKGLDPIESILAKSNAKLYCVGEQLSIADICLIPQLYNAKRFNFDLSQYPRINQIDEHCLEQTAFKDAAPQEMT